MSKFFSTISTEAPFSRAAMPATRPPAPPPMTTMSASRSQTIASAACAGCAVIAPIATAPTAAPEVTKLRLFSAASAESCRELGLCGDLDICVFPITRREACLALGLGREVLGKVVRYQRNLLGLDHRAHGNHALDDDVPVLAAEADSLGDG